MEPSQNNKRKQKDLMNLMLSKYDVVLDEGKPNEFTVAFVGPKGSDYEGVRHVFVSLTKN